MKKKILIFTLILLVIPSVYAFSLLDVLNEGMESITGRSAVTVSISVGNNAPNISYVSLDKQTYAPTDGALTKIEISFLADDPEGLSNLDNTSARANVSLSGTTELNTTCSSATAGEFINYTCEVYMQYYYASSSSWTVEAEIADSNSNYFQNSTGTWTYSAGTYFNLTSPASLAWAAVVPSQTNQSSTTTMVAENTGNQATLNIKTTVIDLGGTSGKYIPAGNFSVFNSTTNDLECESTNQTGAITYGAQPAVGVNNTQIDILLNALARGQGTNPESLFYCLFDVPSYLSSETYDTTSGGSWDITAST